VGVGVFTGAGVGVGFGDGVLVDVDVLVDAASAPPLPQPLTMYEATNNDARSDEINLMSGACFKFFIQILMQKMN
jgi:hypothetical protein